MSASVDRIRNAQRHDRLRELLVAKIEKLAKTHLTDEQKEFVRHEVDLLIQSGDANEASLARVAAGLRMFRPTKSQQPQPAPSHHVAQKASETQKMTSRATPVPAGASPTLSESVRRIPDPALVHADDVWAHLSKIDAEEYHREIVDHRRQLKRKENDQRNYLEAQVRKREEMRERQAEMERRLAVQEELQVKQWREDEQKKKDAIKAQFAAEKALRDEQLKIAQQRKVAEMQQRQDDDRRQAELIRLQAQKEEAVAEAKKVKAKEEVAKFQAYNKMYEDEKQRQREKEAEMDKEHQRMFLERLARQEQERDAAIAKMQEKQKNQQTLATRMEASVAEKAADDERKAQEYAARKEAEYQAQKQRKHQKEMDEKTKTKQFLAMQIIEKEQKRSDERNQMVRERQKLANEIVAAERDEMERQLRLRNKKDMQRQMLEEQMTLRSNQKVVYMTDEERRINARLVEKIASPSPV